MTVEPTLPRVGVERLLDVARRQLAMDVAFLTRFSGRHRTVQAVAGWHPRLQAGRSDPVDDTYCRRLADGHLPVVVPDARADPRTAAIACTTALGIGAHIGVPVCLPDGSVYGTLCSFRSTANDDLDEHDASVLRFIAQAIAEVLLERSGADRAHEQRVSRLRALLQPDQLRIAVQPIRSLRDGRIVAAEALSRFDTVIDSTTVELFLEADALGLGLELELAAVRAALPVVTSMPVPVTVNGSAELWLRTEALELLRDVGLRDVVVELTERHAVSYPDLRTVLAPYRADGLRVAVDDTGAGWAGFQHILQTEPDFLKLDAALVRGVHGSTRQQAMIAALVAFAERTGAQVVAEGIEDRRELACLEALGVGLGQGYLLGRPEPTLPAETSVPPLFGRG